MKFNLSEKRWLFTFEQPKGYNYREEDIAEYIRLLRKDIKKEILEYGDKYVYREIDTKVKMIIDRLAGEKFQ